MLIDLLWRVVIFKYVDFSFICVGGYNYVIVNIISLELLIMKLGWNDVCFCGSGKKYKCCCMNWVLKLYVEFFDDVE